MASEIKVDTVSEKTSGSGVTIDGLLIKDGGISGDVSLIGTTPTFTIGDAGAEDATLLFDGNAQDFHIGLDDSADDLVIGVGSALGTTTAIAIDENTNTTFSGKVTVGVDDTGKDVKFFGASAGAYMEWDESADELRIMGASADATTSTGKLLLATSLTDINANDVLGKIDFQAPHEAGGTDAIAVAASIRAVAQSTFSASSNATDLIFYTGHSEAAAEKIRITSQNEIGIAGANYGTDGQVLTSGGAGAAVAWEDAASFAGIDDQTSSNDDQLTITDSEVAINEDSDDLDFRVESNSYTHAFFVDGGNDRMGSSASGAPDLGFFHIKSADSGADVESHADELVVEGSGNTGISILAGNGDASIINFGDDGANNVGMLSYDHAGNYMRMKTNADVNTVVRLNSSGTLSTGNETAADACAGGLTLDQNALDTFIMTLKSSDVAHSMTGEAEADTYMRMSKYSSTDGGTAIVGYSESGLALYLQGAANASNTTKSTSGYGNIVLKGSVQSGNAAGNAESNGNLVTIANHTNTRFIFDAEGSFHADVESTTYDNYDDAQLVRAFDLSHKKGVIESKFDKFIAYNHENLADMKLVGREEDGTPNHFINVTKFQQLHNGAIWQQYEKHNQLLEAVYDLAKEAVGEEKANAILDKHEVKRLQ